jgi:centrosomal protein CEP41
MSNVSGVSAVTYATEMLGITDETSFLLLDLREPEDYDFWRIKEAISFPAANIARDKMIPELFRFKNKANKLIIVYMNDERKGTAAANLMSEKGYENVFLLSGGIESFNEDFHHLVEGRDVPTPKSHI